MSILYFKVFAGQMFCGWLQVQVSEFGTYHMFFPPNAQPFHADECKRKLNNYAQLNLVRTPDKFSWN